MTNTESLAERNFRQKKQAYQKIQERLVVLTPFEKYINQRQKIKVKNPKCGHIFESRAGNLANAKTECPVCNTEKKRERLRNLNQERTNSHHEWLKSEGKHFEVYYRLVRALTRKAYRENKETINPEDLPLGRCGTPNTYQVDHILSIKHCFLESISAEECSALENLQVIPWEENLNRRDMTLQGK